MRTPRFYAEARRIYDRALAAIKHRKHICSYPGCWRKGEECYNPGCFEGSTGSIEWVCDRHLVSTGYCQRCRVLNTSFEPDPALCEDCYKEFQHGFGEKDDDHD